MKAITENLALASILALSIGLLRLKSYYDILGVDIMSYVEISEVFQLQFSYLLILSVIVLQASWFLYGLYAGRGLKFDSAKAAIVSEDKKFSFDMFILLAYALTFTLMIYFIGYRLAAYDARSIKQGKAEYEVVMKTENTTITTDKNLFYIGKTKQYIFFYIKNKKQVAIFKNDDIKYILFSKGIDHSGSNK